MPIPILSFKAPTKDNNKLITSRKITPSGSVIFNNDVANIEWLNVWQANNPDIAYDVFITKIKTIMKCAFLSQQLK